MPTRGPQAGPVMFYYTGLIPMIKTMVALQNRVNTLPMDAVVRRVAEPWRDNYDGEGFAVGGWPLLSEYTQNIRRWRGYPAEHPIMRQGGGLRRAAVEVPLAFKGKGVSRITSATRSSDGTPTNISITTVNSGRTHRANLKISGSKVANQFGGQNTGMGWQRASLHRLPARKFWFVNNEVREKMAEGALEGVKPEMDKLGGRIS